MHRRQFNQQISKLGLASIFSPLLLGSCKKSPWFFEAPAYGGKVIIIGAGVAGLYAAYLLKKNGVEVQVLEASPFIGGRLRKNDSFSDFNIDLGAEWLHGKNSILYDWVRHSKIETYTDNSELLVLLDGKLQSTETGVDPELKKLLRRLERMDFENIPTNSDLYQWASSEGFSARLNGVLDYFAGENGTSATRLNAHYYALESDNWSAGGVDVKFKKSFYDCMNELLFTEVAGLVNTNTIVESIDYTGDEILVQCHNNQLFKANKVIITVPIPILKDGDIQFIPTLPNEKLQAIQKIGMDAGMKIVLKFSTKFWTNSIMGTSISPSYLDSTYGKNSNEHIYTAFVMGEKADFLSGLGAGAIPVLLQELDEIYNGQASASFLDSLIMDWKKEPFVRGAYSYSSHEIGNSRAVLAEPLVDKLYFAGEATNYNGHHQSVHGALETGYREALQILKKKTR